MELVKLEHQPPVVTVDENTKLLLEEAPSSARCGETVTLEQSTTNMKRRLEAWRNAKADADLTAWSGSREQRKVTAVLPFWTRQ